MVFTIAAAVVVGRVPAAVLLGRLDPVLLLPLAAVPPLITGRHATRTIERARTQTATSTRVALNYFCCFRQKPLPHMRNVASRSTVSWCFEMRNVMDDHPASSGAEKSVLDAVLAAYRQVLDDPGVSPDDDFFELGGDSFQAMDIMAALEETIGKQINAGVIFAFPTATGLATAIMKTADASP